MNISQPASIPDRTLQPQDEKQHSRNKVLFYGLIVLGFALVIAFLWLPFGFLSSDNWDGWMFFARLDQGNFMLFNPNFITRPFTSLPWIIAYLISSNSFLGHNIILASLLLAKGILTYAIVSRLLRGQAAVAFMAGVLSIVYPADTGVFFLSALNIHLSIVLFLLAFYLFILHWDNRKRWVFIISLLALVGVMGIYEAAFPLIFIVPLLVIWYVGRIPRRLVILSSVWYALAAVGFIFNVLALGSHGSEYQSSLLATQGLATRVTSGVRYVYGQHFIQGFTDALTLGNSVLQGHLPILYLVLALASGLITGLIAALLQIFTPTKRIAYSVIGMMSAIGFIIILLGYVMYIPTGFLGTNWRTFFFSSWGASIALACGCALLGYLSRKSRVKWVGLLVAVTLVFLVVSGRLDYILLVFGFAVILLALLPRSMFFVVTLSLIVTLGMLYSLSQHNDYDQSGRKQLAELRSIEQQAPRVKSETLILLLDEGGPIDHTPSPLSDYPEHFIYDYLFDSAIKVIYQDSSLHGHLCHQAFKVLNQDACIFSEQGVNVNYPFVVWDPVVKKETYPYSQMIVFLLTPDGKITIQDSIPSQYLGEIKATDYQPNALITPDDKPLRRTSILLGE